MSKFNYADAFRGAVIFSITFYLMGLLFRTVGAFANMVLRVLYSGG